MNIADHAIGAADSPALIVADGAHDLVRRAVRQEPARRRAAARGGAAARRRGRAGAAEPPRVPRNHLGLPAFRAVLQRGEHPLHARRGGLRHRRLRGAGRCSSTRRWPSWGADPARSTPASTSTSVVGGALPGWRSYEDALAAAGDAPPISDGSEMLYSSGTTGRPKAVRRPLPEDGKGSWAQKVLEYSLTQRYGMTASSVYLSPAPLYHAAGVNYTMAVHRVGAASIVMPKFDAETVLRLIETHRVTHAQFVPTMFVRMLKLPDAVRERYDVSSLQCVIHAAAPCPVDVKHRMMEWFGPDHPRVLRRHRGIRGHDDRPRGVARPPRLGRQAVQPGARRRRGRGRAARRASRASCTSRADRRSSTSRTRRRRRRCPTIGAGDRWGTWATSTRTATCTSPTGRRS